ncbi:DeoR family transcriptional regulator [bacterium]|nr:MAG: DeoR family transcriptional regulator [bacterium]
MDENELRKIIETGESETAELKPSLSQINDIVESASAFSNAGGGKILVGVSNSGKILGVDVGKDTIERLANKIVGNTEPKVYPKISVEKIERKKIIVIDVPKSEETVLSFGRPFKRVGKSTIRMDKSEYEKTVHEKKKRYWDSEICENAALADIDGEKVRWFLRKAKDERNFDVEPATPIKEALERLELVKNEKLTNAAVLLFGRNPQRFFLQAETRCARFKGTEHVKPFLDMKVFGGDIIGQVDKSMNFALEHIPMKVYLAGKTEREEKYEYPQDAVREAIINAICHRDYVKSSNVQIRIFDDRIEVWGCGRLPEPLTPEDLKKKHKSVLRNPLIAKCFFLIRFVEQWGTGTNDIVEMCLEWGLPEPLFEEIAGDFVITIRKYYLTDEVLKQLSERQRIIAEYLREHGKINRSECMKLLNIAKDTAFRELIALQEKNIIKREGIGKSVYYTLK